MFAPNSVTVSEEIFPKIKAATDILEYCTPKHHILIHKAVLLNDLMSECSLDLIGFTKTWLKLDEYTPLNEATPPDFV